MDALFQWIKQAMMPGLVATLAVQTTTPTNPWQSPSTSTPALKISDQVGLWQVTADGCATATLALQGLNIPYTVNTVKGGASNTLELTNADGSPRYSALVICTDRLAYESGGAYPSALTDAQWAQFEAYQVKYGVRRVTFGVWPGPSMGINWPPAGDCCRAADHGTDDQLASITPEALSMINFTGINPTGQFSTKGLSHYPTTLYTLAKSDGWGTAVPILEFAPTSKVFTAGQRWIGGAVTTYPNNRQDMNFFMAFGPWSTTSLVLQHLWIQWALRSSYPGYRRVFLIPQIDDLFLDTPVTINKSVAASPYLWDQQNNDQFNVRLSVDDVKVHQAWLKDLKTRLPPGSNFTIEMCYNGNGPLLFGKPESGIILEDYVDVPNTMLFKKKLGTGTNNWPVLPLLFLYSQSKLKTDPLYNAFVTSTDLKRTFYWVSHTFTHMNLNNGTYTDVYKEMSFNRALAGYNYLNLDNDPVFSPNCLVPPMITGLLNGDALRAMVDNKVYIGCGDNTRKELLNLNNPFQPLITTSKDNGYDGFVIIPRYATNIYYNVSTLAESEYLFKTIYYNTVWNSATWREIFNLEQERVVAQLIALHPDAYMFHQANLRSADITTQLPPFFPNGKFSLVMLWVETIIDGLKKYVNWPVVTRPMQEMSSVFIDRLNRDTCGATMAKLINKDGFLYGIQVNGGTKSCTWPITLPGDVDNRANYPSFRFEKLSAADPLTVWVPTSPGKTQQILLQNPVRWF